MKDVAKLKALHQEIATARDAGVLDAALAQRIHAEAILAAENDPRFLESFFHALPPELLKREVDQHQSRYFKWSNDIKGKVDIRFFSSGNLLQDQCDIEGQFETNFILKIHTDP